jgi:predicted nucleic acid-binding protein
MIHAFVADASVAVAWVHPAQGSAATAAMLDALADGARLEVPALWTLEVANALTVLARRRKLTGEERQTALGWLRGLPLAIDHEGSALAFTRLAEIADAYGLSIYDATYLELAQRRQLPLACLDGAFRIAAGRAGVALWE